MSPSNPRHVYVDTQYVHAYLFSDNSRKKDEEFIAKAQVDHLLTNRNSNQLLKIPHVVMGEIINNIHRRDSLNETNINRRILNMMGNDKLDFVPASKDCLKLTNDLLNMDRDLDATDTIIVSQALCDSFSSHLLMKDGRVIGSPAIDEINQNYKDRNKRTKLLKITSEIVKLGR